MVMYGAEELVSSSELAKKFGTYLSRINTRNLEKIAVLKNNKVEAVLLPKEDYEKMCETLKRLEAKNLLDSIDKGLKDMKEGRTSPIDTLWDRLDD
ncbi:type II toxin-antitoxin system Phd/YefM family antitoxin [Nitratifractor sp.]|uniref:type II toxin-antitoxin system Phd/YefM family antitoxin n=1 Tax=Nitratifractor sp. TaxID=2268144 RepID=UPI0025EE054F|nr:type II toxin-antitoxin system Phd/YefM family antitoxin [Nitratifractor sp.]